MFTDEQIALVCHEANRGLQEVLGDPHPSEPWTVSSQEVKDSAIEGVARARQGATPRENHEEWRAFKIDKGWRYGPVKDEVAKTHPCLVDYDELSPGDRLKDELFVAVVTAMVINPIR